MTSTRPGLLHVEFVMGTAVTLDLRDRHLPAGTLEEAVRHAVAVLHAADRTFSTWRSDSPVSRLGRGEIALSQCPAELGAVLRLCDEARTASGGWFDPWAMPGGVDPTGLVKGWAAQRALHAMRQVGVRHATVNAGGDVMVTGDASGDGDGSGWTIGVTDPSDTTVVITTIQGTGLGVATSGAYERGTLAVDPRTGRRVCRLASATVVGPDLARADALATAATAHGPAALDWLQALPGIDALLVDLDGTVLTTRGFPE